MAETKKTRAKEACAMEVSFGFVLRKKGESDEACETQWRWCILDEESSFLGKKICLGVKSKVGGGEVGDMAMGTRCSACMKLSFAWFSNSFR